MGERTGDLYGMLTNITSHTKSVTANLIMQGGTVAASNTGGTVWVNDQPIGITVDSSGIVFGEPHPLVILMDAIGVVPGSCFTCLEEIDMTSLFCLSCHQAVLALRDTVIRNEIEKMTLDD